jgi:CRISPR-associated protein Csd1
MLLHALYDFYQRACREGLIQEPAFRTKHVRWIVPLTSAGELEGDGLIENPEPQKGGRVFKVPRTSRPKKGREAEFLSDELDAVFCLHPNPSKPKDKKMLEVKHSDFWRQIEEAYQATAHRGLEAVLKFHEIYPSPAFVQLEEQGGAAGWTVSLAGGGKSKLKAGGFTFRVNGQHLLDDEGVLHPYWREAYAQEQGKKEADARKGICLITGKTNVAVLKSHLPLIVGVPNTNQNRGYVVSAYDKSTWSYGLEQGWNAPVSVEAVEAYCNALNFLLDDKRHRVRVGDTVLCFWARGDEEATADFSAFLDDPQPEEVRAFLYAPLRGDARQAALREDQFYSVAFGGNVARVVVRHWMQTTVGRAVENFRRWFEDLNIVAQYPPRDEKFPPLAIRQLARATLRAAGGKAPKDEEIGAETATQLYRAALEALRRRSCWGGPCSNTSRQTWRRTVWRRSTIFRASRCSGWSSTATKRRVNR